MSSILTAFGFLTYGLLVYYDIYTPNKGGGSGIAIFFIASGIAWLIAIPFIKKQDIGNKDNYIDIIKKDKCTIINTIGLIIFFLFLFEYVNDFIFMSSLLAMIFCEIVIKFFSKNNRAILFLRIFMTITFLLMIARLIISNVTINKDVPILVIIFLTYIIYSISFKIKYQVINIIAYLIGLLYTIKFAYRYEQIIKFEIDAHSIHYIFMILSFLILLFISTKDIKRKKIDINEV